jgi:UDP-N-acetylglucosamine acyltransferase
VQGPRGVLDGLNLVGLKRRGTDKGDINALRDLYAALGEGNFRENARRIAEDKPQGTLQGALVDEVLSFILGPSDRSFLTPR